MGRAKSPPDPTDPVTAVPGLGPAAARSLARLSIDRVEDLIFHVPRAYRDRRVITPVAELEPDSEAVIEGTVVASRSRRGRRARILEVVVDDGTGRCTCVWFRAPVYLMDRFARGKVVKLAGTLEPGKRVPTFYHPEIVDGDGGVVPVYGTTEGVSTRRMATWVGKALDAALDTVVDRVPATVRERAGLMRLTDAVAALHRPAEDVDLAPLVEGTSEAHRAMLFQDLFGIQLALAIRRRSIRSAPAVSTSSSRALIDRAIASLPFVLTGAQQRAVEEIRDDLLDGKPACRLLQGDVGSGKTVVAMLAALPVLEAGHQVAMMVPTEILADQHMREADKLLGPLGYSSIYLGGSLRARPRRDALERIETGTAQVVVGTQALFQPEVAFADLGLVVVDEQHRFGVEQRSDLATKGAFPHVLAMSATPIPRSLAMALYGDLDLSVIDELPPRGEILSELVEETDRDRVYAEVRAAVGRGERVFVVHPLVESSDKLDDVRDAVSMSTALAEGPLRGLDVGLLHGRMDPFEKEEIVDRFRSGAIQVLATTTVVEVGIDVPEATVMVIENADRFGLAQLHQLRGRIGRSTRTGRCYLFCQRGTSHQRLRILAGTRDGFAIAEADLAHRGPGDLMGKLQAGRPGYTIPTTRRFSQILAEAKREAHALVGQDGFEGDPEYAELRELVKRKWGASFRLRA